MSQPSSLQNSVLSAAEDPIGHRRVLSMSQSQLVAVRTRYFRKDYVEVQGWRNGSRKSTAEVKLTVTKPVSVSSRKEFNQLPKYSPGKHHSTLSIPTLSRKRVPESSHSVLFLPVKSQELKLSLAERKRTAKIYLQSCRSAPNSAGAGHSHSNSDLKDEVLRIPSVVRSRNQDMVSLDIVKTQSRCITRSNSSESVDSQIAWTQQLGFRLPEATKMIKIDSPPVQEIRIFEPIKRVAIDAIQRFRRKEKQVSALDTSKNHDSGQISESNSSHSQQGSIDSSTPSSRKAGFIPSHHNEKPSGKRLLKKELSTRHVVFRDLFESRKIIRSASFSYSTEEHGTTRLFDVFLKDLKSGAIDSQEQALRFIREELKDSKVSQITRKLKKRKTEGILANPDYVLQSDSKSPEPDPMPENHVLENQQNPSIAVQTYESLVDINVIKTAEEAKKPSPGNKKNLLLIPYNQLLVRPIFADLNNVATELPMEEEFPQIPRANSTIGPVSDPFIFPPSPASRNEPKINLPETLEENPDEKRRESAAKRTRITNRKTTAQWKQDTKELDEDLRQLFLREKPVPSPSDISIDDEPKEVVPMTDSEPLVSTEFKPTSEQKRTREIAALATIPRIRESTSIPNRRSSLMAAKSVKKIRKNAMQRRASALSIVKELSNREKDVQTPSIEKAENLQKLKIKASIGDSSVSSRRQSTLSQEKAQVSTENHSPEVSVPVLQETEKPSRKNQGQRKKRRSPPPVESSQKPTIPLDEEAVSDPFDDFTFQFAQSLLVSLKMMTILMRGTQEEMVKLAAEEKEKLIEETSQRRRLGLNPGTTPQSPKFVLSKGLARTFSLQVCLLPPARKPTLVNEVSPYTKWGKKKISDGGIGEGSEPLEEVPEANLREAESSVTGTGGNKQKSKGKLYQSWAKKIQLKVPGKRRVFESSEEEDEDESEYIDESSPEGADGSPLPGTRDFLAGSAEFELKHLAMVKKLAEGIMVNRSSVQRSTRKIRFFNIALDEAEQKQKEQEDKHVELSPHPTHEKAKNALYWEEEAEAEDLREDVTDVLGAIMKGKSGTVRDFAFSSNVNFNFKSLEELKKERGYKDLNADDNPDPEGLSNALMRQRFLETCRSLPTQEDLMLQQRGVLFISDPSVLNEDERIQEFRKTLKKRIYKEKILKSRGENHVRLRARPITTFTNLPVETVKERKKPVSATEETLVSDGKAHLARELRERKEREYFRLKGEKDLGRFERQGDSGIQGYKEIAPPTEAFIQVLQSVGSKGYVHSA